jgi:hypothetical protein
MIGADFTLVASDKRATSRRLGRTPRCGQRLLFALLLGAACRAVAGGDIDPLHSGACKTAQAALEHDLQNAAAGNAAAKQELGSVRRQALEACLGPQTGHDQRSGAPSVPIAVHSPALAPQQGNAPVPAPALQTAPMHSPRPVAITSCDAGGCWDSQGQRLNFMGSVLIAPNGGVCSSQAGTVQCPQ